MAKQVRFFDGHNDALLWVWRAGDQGERRFIGGGGDEQLDLPKALAGGLSGGLFAVFVPSKPAQDKHLPRQQALLRSVVSWEEASRVASEQLAVLRRLQAASGGKLVVAGSLEEVRSVEEGALVAVPHLEGAEPVGEDLSDLEQWHDLGIRSIGLVWARANAFGEGVPMRIDSTPDTGPGLTPAGKELVRRCRKLGILVDLSHLNEKGFYDAADAYQGPVVATHSNAHAICPAARNLTDEQLEVIRDTEGMVGVCFNTADMYPDGSSDTDRGLGPLLDHVEYMLERVGEDSVGFGSDFDGCPIPDDIGNASGLPTLAGALKSRGYPDDLVRKLARENWLRILAECLTPC